MTANRYFTHAEQVAAWHLYTEKADARTRASHAAELAFAAWYVIATSRDEMRAAALLETLTATSEVEL